MTIQKKKLLHLVQDSFFTDFLIPRFEKVNPGLNHYVYLSILEQRPKFIKENSKVQCISLFSIAFLRLVKYSGKYEAIMFHFLTPLKAWFAILSSRKPKLVWFIWGGDYYNSINNLRKDLYEPETKKLIKKHITHKWLTREILVPTFLFIFNPVKYVIGKINFSAPVFFEEYELLRPYFKPDNTYLPFTYAVIEPKEISIPEIRNNRNILLGNNSWPTNNHLDILYLLTRFNLEDRKIITPLSYGSRIYRSQVIKNCPKEIRNNFFPISSFLPKDEYLLLIHSCNIAILNYNRQQGIGNVIELLANGCKIYINENTTTWTFLKRIGATVYSIQKDLSPKNPEVFSPLSDEIIIKNKKVIEEEYSSENNFAKIAFCISAIYSD